MIAAGNFSVLAATLLHAATVAAAHVSHWEVIDYGSAGKPDAPSGTSRELAERLAEIEPPLPAEHDADLIGPPEARGASVAGTRIHSLRLPGYSLSTDVVLATADERLVVRHEAGPSAGALHRGHAARDPPRAGDHRRRARPRPPAVPVRTADSRRGRALGCSMIAPRAAATHRSPEFRRRC